MFISIIFYIPYICINIQYLFFSFWLTSLCTQQEVLDLALYYLFLVVQAASGSHNEGTLWLACCALDFLLPPDLFPGDHNQPGLQQLASSPLGLRDPTSFSVYTPTFLYPIQTVPVGYLLYVDPGWWGRGDTSWKILSWLQVVSSSVQFISVAQSWSTLCSPVDCSMPGLLLHHQLPESTQIHVHWVGDAIQWPHPLSSPFPPTLNLSQHQGLFKWVSSLYQVAKVLEFQLQHQSFQWTFRTDFL